jgi:hypothetical protein
MEATVRQHREQHRPLARRTRHRDPQIGFVLRQAEGAGAVGKHRRRCFPCVETASVYLCDMDDEDRLDPPGSPEQGGQSP